MNKKAYIPQLYALRSFYSSDFIYGYHELFLFYIINFSKFLLPYILPTNFTAFYYYYLYLHL